MRAALLRSVRAGAVALLVLGGLAGCGGEEAAPYCTQVADYLDFEARFGTVTVDPDALEGYMDEWVGRLDDLEEVAPAGVDSDLREFAAGVSVVDERMAARDYDVLELAVGELEVDGMDVAFNAFQESMGRDCGLGPQTPDLDAPQPLTAEERAALGGDLQLVDLVAEELALAFDLDDTTARCLAEAMDDSDFGRLIEGRPLLDGGSEAFVAAIDDCGVDPATFGGDS